MDRFGIVIERQEQLEALIKEWGFLPFFRNGIKGFSIEEMTPPCCMAMTFDHLQRQFPDVEKAKI